MRAEVPQPEALEGEAEEEDTWMDSPPADQQQKFTNLPPEEEAILQEWCSQEHVSLPTDALNVSDGSIKPLSPQEERELRDHITSGHVKKSNLCKGCLLSEGDSEGPRKLHKRVRDLCPEIVSVREHVDPIIRRLMTSLSTKNNTEEEDEFMQEFIPSCFDDTCDGLMDRDIPLDGDTQSTLGMAVESFPKLIPQVFDIYRKAAKRMFARQAEERRQSLEEVEAAAQLEAQPGCNVPEFTQHLMNLLEERTPREHWDADLRSTLTDQLTYFLSQNTCGPKLLSEAVSRLSSTTHHRPKQTVEGEVWHQ